MSQRDRFAGGFVTGAIVGGIVGGVLGSLLVSKKNNETNTDNKYELPSNHLGKITPQDNIEVARRSLEDKIAQLNLAIDDVRQQLGKVNEKETEKE